MELQLKRKEQKKEGEKKGSAFDASGINKAIYTNNFDSELLNSYVTELIALSKQAQKYYEKKVAIRKNELRYKAYLEKGAITKQQFDSYMFSYLKGNDVFQVYEMYDSYIRSLTNKMRSITDAIFQYLENHTYSIPLEQKVVLEETVTKKSMSKKTEETPDVDTTKWQSKADTFVKRKKKQVISDSIASTIVRVFKTLLKSKKKKRDIFSERTSKGKFQSSQNKKSIFSLIFGAEKSIFEKGRNETKKKVQSFLKQYSPKKNIISKRTALSDKFKNVRRIKIESKEQKDDTASLGLIGEQSHSDIGLDSVVLNKSEQKSVSYSANSYSSLANILMKNISIEFIDSFPDFFKKLYKTLRLANIKILSSSYTNMMLLSSIIGAIVGFILFSTWSFLALVPFGMIFANGFLGGLLIGSAVFLVYYSYPNYEAKRRDRDIKANISFAIDHMAAIVSAGVSPNAMLSLVSESNDYGEFSVEIGKVVEYIELFGYDMITAINTVSALTPSNSMKDFLEGFVSSIESGGDLKKYLREKADASMLQYKLERQRYTESVSTFSDIYTGIMVASPLFFVAVLSLVSILGGTVGNMDINTLMILGTYVAIPALNLLFMGFMELTQPNL